MTETFAIAGGGASGVIAAAHLLHESPHARVLLFEPGTPGLGVAYATTCPLHVLNVPAAAMSAVAGNPMHFVQWLRTHAPGTYGASSFVPRSVYGQYLHDIYHSLTASFGDRFVHVAQPLSSVTTLPRAATVILATGAGHQAEWPGAPDDPRYYRNAWLPSALVPGAKDERVLVLGTGLSAVDAVLGLRHNGHRGSVHLVSRRGLLPHEHRFLDAPPGPVERSGDLRTLLTALRNESRTNWRAAVDGLRPHSNALWQALSVEDQRRFLRHLLPYWNVHRHRMAPEAAAHLAQLFAAGVLTTIAGRVQGFETTAREIRVRILERGAPAPRTMSFDRIINCSGSTYGGLDSRSALLRSLAAQGRLRANALGTGIDVAMDGAVVAQDGRPSPSLYAIGPLRFGSAFETTAIPEIRTQAADLARLLRAKARAS